MPETLIVSSTGPPLVNLSIRGFRLPRRIVFARASIRPDKRCACKRCGGAAVMKVIAMNAIGILDLTCHSPRGTARERRNVTHVHYISSNSHTTGMTEHLFPPLYSLLLLVGSIAMAQPQGRLTGR